MKKIFVLISLIFLFVCNNSFASRMYGCTALTGGASGSLDALDITAASAPNSNNLAEGDSAIVSTISGTTVIHYFYIFDSSGTDAESSPDVIRPDDYTSSGVWLLTHTSFSTQSGDSKIQVTDSGSGTIDNTVDGEIQNTISDGYFKLINGTAFRLLTTTDGHTYIFQTYDANGTTWRDVLTFENGDSSDSNPNNWPRVSLGTNTALTGLGNMATGMIWGNTGVPLVANQDLEASGMNQIYKVGATIQVNLPAAADAYSTGSDAAWVKYVIVGAYTVSIDPDGSEKIRAVSTTAGILAAGNELDMTGPGYITCILTDDTEDGSSTDGAICWSNMTLSDGGAS